MHGRALSLCREGHVKTHHNKPTHNSQSSTAAKPRCCRSCAEMPCVSFEAMLHRTVQQVTLSSHKQPASKHTAGAFCKAAEMQHATFRSAVQCLAANCYFSSVQQQWYMSMAHACRLRRVYHPQLHDSKCQCSMQWCTGQVQCSVELHRGQQTSEQAPSQCKLY
jgi:hypothetical protein